MFSGAGRWSELPLPGNSTDDARVRSPSASRAAPRAGAARVDLDAPTRAVPGVVEEWMSRGMDLVQRDPVVVFIVIASALALGLAGILFTIS